MSMSKRRERPCDAYSPLPGATTRTCTCGWALAAHSDIAQRRDPNQASTSARVTEDTLRGWEGTYDPVKLAAAGEIRRNRALLIRIAEWSEKRRTRAGVCPLCGATSGVSGHAEDCDWPALEAEVLAILEERKIPTLR